MTAISVVMLRKLVSVVVTLRLDPVSLSLIRKITNTIAVTDCSCLQLENSHELGIDIFRLLQISTTDLYYVCRWPFQALLFWKAESQTK